MGEQLAALTALRGIRGKLDECEEGNLGVKKLDEVLSKYLEWLNTEFLEETISLFRKLKNHSTPIFAGF